MLNIKKHNIDWNKNEKRMKVLCNFSIQGSYYSSNEILFARIVSYEVNYPMTIKRDKSQCHGNTKNFSRSITHVLLFNWSIINENY